MVSFGDIRQNKFIYGENPLAKYFGICMFDFVFLFVEEKKFVQYILLRLKIKFDFV